MKRSDLLAALWEPRKRPLVYLGAAYAIGASINLFSSWAEAHAWLRWGLLIGVPLALLGLLFSRLFDDLWPWAHREPVARVLAARPCKGLIVLVSAGLGSATARAAIDYHAADGLQRVWMLHSDSSRDQAESIVEEFCRDPRFTRDSFDRIPLSDADFEDPERVREALELGVFGALPDGISEGEVVIDVTGGKKTTTAGAFLVGLPPGRRLQVVSASQRDENLRGTVAGAPFEIVMDLKVRPARPRR